MKDFEDVTLALKDKERRKKKKTTSKDESQ